MGYSTDFNGELKFKKEASASQLAELNKYLGEDRRDIGLSDLNVGWYHIDLKLTKDFSGIEWNGQEKTYHLDEIVNWLTGEMRMKFPEFELTGELNAQGEEFSDRWILKMVAGKATKKEVKIAGDVVECPDCGHEFINE